MPKETVFSDSSVILIGRLVDDITIGTTGAPAAFDLLKAGSVKVARIYSFVYQNELVDLASPALFLVPATPDGDVNGNLAADKSGLSHLAGMFASGLSCWTLDASDMTVRLDVMTGSIGRILLDHELAEGGLQDYVRGGKGVGMPGEPGGRRGGRRWRSEDD